MEICSVPLSVLYCTCGEQVWGGEGRGGEEREGRVIGIGILAEFRVPEQDVEKKGSVCGWESSLVGWR
jgi:hypothetical protein